MKAIDTKKILNIVITLVLVVGLSPAGAWAIASDDAAQQSTEQQNNVQQVDSTGMAKVEFLEWDDTENKLVSASIGANGTKEIASYTVIDASSTSKVTWNAGWYVVKGAVTLSAGAVCNGAVHLILTDGCNLQVSGVSEACAGIAVFGDTNSLAIYGQTGQSGKLSATGDGSCAGIGGGANSNGSNITINGGTVTAKGGWGAAGIGSGIGFTLASPGAHLNVSSFNITINGGTVTASGGAGGAGIGGGAGASASDIAIAGGTVTAIGGDVDSSEYYKCERGSGIGCGGRAEIETGSSSCIHEGSASNITVAANRSVRAGNSNPPSTIIAHMSDTDIASSLKDKKYATVSFHDEVAYIDTDGASRTIGGSTGTDYTLVPSNTTSTVTWSAGWYVVQGSMNLSKGVTCSGAVHLILADGCNLTVTGAESCAGITVSGNANRLAIYGQAGQSGKLSTTGGKYGAGIGGNTKGSGSNITINGGTVTAKGGDAGAGIGGGYQGDGSDIAINGGSVTATGGGGGAGIGGGHGKGSGSDITINGGTVTATGGISAAGIGGGAGDGGSGGSASSITINGGSVTATGGSLTSYTGPGIGGGYGASSSNIKVEAALIVKADNNNPPTTLIDHTSSADVAGDLSGKRYVTVSGVSATVTFNGETTRHATFMEAWDAMCAAGSQSSASTTNRATLKMYADYRADGDFSGTNVNSGALALPAGYFKLDLNGHTLSRGRTSATSCGSVIKMDNANSIDLYIYSSTTPGTITGGYSSYSDENSWRAGGVAMTTGKLTLGEGACISGNTGKQGAGVYVASGCTLVLDGGAISGNAATTNSGGVCVVGGTFTMNSGTISGNTSAGSGGGVTTQNGATMTMSGGTISGNKTTGSDAIGGGVYVNKYNSASTFTMTGGTISNNTSPQGGGVGVEKGTAFTMSGNATISGNTATKNSGGVFVTGGTFTMDSGTISGNASNGIDGIGGGVLTQNGGAFTMSGGTISNNTANDDGGGVYVNNYSSASTFTMTGGTISGNTATVSGSSGGGVYVQSSCTFKMSGGTISGNTVAAHGAGVYRNGDDMIVGGTAKIEGNTDASAKGDLYLPSGKTVRIGNEINGVPVPAEGMSIGVLTEATPTGATEVDVTPAYNPANYAGYFFANNTAYKIYNYGTASFQKVVLDFNTPAQVSTDGGSTWTEYAFPEAWDVMCAAGSKSTESNRVKLKMLADYNAGGSFACTNKNEGALALPAGYYEVDLNGHTLSRGLTSAIQHGSVMIMENDGIDLYIYSSTGAGIITGGRNFRFEAGKDYKAGGISLSKGKLTLGAGANISKNHGMKGGGVYVASGCTLLLDGGTISNNEVSAQGGGVYSEGTLKMNAGTVTGNNSSSEGGGVYMHGGTFTMEGGTVSNNKSDGSGGGVHIYDGTFTMEGGTVSNNTTNRSNTLGGGIYISPGSSMTMSDGSITGNTARAGGGGVYASDAPFTMDGGTISGNKTTNSDSKGGGVCNNGTMKVSGTAKIAGNTASAATDNVYLPSGKTIAVGTGDAPNAKHLESGALIGVTTEDKPTPENPVAITGANGADYSQCFTSDSPARLAGDNANTVVLKAADANAPTAEASISLDDSIDVNFYITPKADGYAAGEIYVKRTAYHGGTPSDEAPWQLTDNAKSTVSGGAYRFVADRAAAPQMTDIVKVELFRKNGESCEKIKEYTYSVRQYCNARIAENADANLVALCKATLDYGSASQTHFGVNASDLANGGAYTGDLAATGIPASVNVAKASGKIDGVSASGSLILNSATTIRFYLKGLADAGEYTFTLDDEQVTPTALKNGSGQTTGYYADKTGVSSVDLNEPHVLKVSEGDQVKATITYSALSYAYYQVERNPDASESLKNVCKTLYLYHKAADTYFPKAD